MSGFVQNGATHSVANGTNQPTITGVTAGNTLICVYHVFDAITLSAPTDSSGQTWTIRVQANGQNQAIAIAYLLNANAGTHTLTWATTPDASTAAISEWNGITGVGGTGVTNTNVAATSATSASYTPGSSSEVVIAFCGETGSGTNDGIHCTTAGFQSIGSLSDSASHSCWAVQQNGSSFEVAEANAQIITSSSALTCAWAWTPSLQSATAVAGFAYTAGASGSAAVVEGGDIPSGAAATATSSSAAIAESLDIVVGAGGNSTSTSGAVAIVESHDVVAASGSAASVTIAPGQSSIGTTTGATSVTTSAVTTTGNGFYIGVIQYFPSAPQAVSVSDSKGNTYTHIGTQLSDGSARAIDRFYCQGGTPGAGHTATATVGTSAPLSIFFQEMLNAATTALLDPAGSNTNAGFAAPPYPSGNVTISPSAYGEMMISLLSTEEFAATITFSEANGFTIQEQNNVGNNGTMAGAVGTKVVTSNGTYSASWSDGSGGSQFGAVIDSFNGGPPGPASGTAAVVESLDIIVGSGSLSVSGSASILESVDLVASVSSSGGVGSAALIEALDIVAGAGSAAFVVASLPSPGPGISPSSRFQFSTFAFNTTIIAQSSAAIVESSDAVAGAGGTATSSTAAILEGMDALANAAAQGALGAAAIFEAGDIVVASGSTADALAASIQEGYDVIAASGGTSVSGVAAVLESPDVVSGGGTNGASALASILEAGDVIVGIVAQAGSATAAMLETSDTMVAAGATATSSTASIVEASDLVVTLAAAGANGIAALLEGADGVAGSAQAIGGGNAAVIESYDVIAATAAMLTGGFAAIFEGADIVLGVGSVPNMGAAAIAELSDGVAGTGLLQGAVRFGNSTMTVGPSTHETLINPAAPPIAIFLEDSACFVTVNFIDANGDPFIPASAQYRLDDVASGTQILGWTPLALTATSMLITVTGTQNALIGRPFETHQCLVQLTDSFGNVDNVRVTWGLCQVVGLAH